MRNKTLSIRLTPKELAMIEATAELSSRKPSDWARLRLMDNIPGAVEKEFEKKGSK